MLNANQKHLLRLVREGMKEGDDGWAKVSSTVWPLLDSIPVDLIERKSNLVGGGRCCLTSRGEAVVDYLL